MLEYLQSYIIAHKNQKGASAVEYGLLVAAIAAVIVLIVFALGKVVAGSFSETCSAIGGASACT